MKLYYKTVLIMMIFIISNNKIGAQVGMMENNPSKSAALDLGLGNKGLLISSINLASTSDITSFNGTTPATSLLIMNTNPAITNGFGTGYYYWDSVWKKLAVSGETAGFTDWSLGGNTGVNSKTDFLGTTDAKNLILKTKGKEIVRLTGSGALGIGITNPTHALDVDAGDGGIRFRNLPTIATTSSANYVVIANDGAVTKSEAINSVGEFIRVGLNEGNILPTNSQEALRFNLQSTAASMGTTPGGEPNFLNSIKESVISTNVTRPVGKGTYARTTDVITLPAGVYRITLRLTGYFLNNNNNISFKIIIDNNEYSMFEGIGNGGSIALKEITRTVSDLLILSSKQEVDFCAEGNGSVFNVRASSTVGTGTVYGSMIMIERLR